MRRALNHASDHDTLGRSLWGGGFRRMAALQTPAFGEMYDAGRQGFAYDPERARKLLAEAGWRPEAPLIVRVPAGYYLNMLQAVQVIQSMWEAVGVPSRLEVRENLSLVQQPWADVRPTSVAFRFPDPLGGGLMVHLAKGYFVQDQGYWQPGGVQPDRGGAARGDELAERRRLFHRLMDELEAEAPAAILYAPMEVIGKRRGMRFAHYPLYYLDFRGANLAFG